MPAPASILELVERFERNREQYRTATYNETQTRREFIDPLFAALGWDVANTGGATEAFKDVIHEDAIKIGGYTKAPDYCFLTGGVRRFFVEAKKPSVNVRDDLGPAFQVRRYAWSAKLPLSIVTDFEEWAVYDCRVQPAKTDAAAVARVHYFTYRDYAERWDEIAALFSRDAVLAGSLDQYLDTHRAPKGTATVDAAFLREIEAWRELLADNIAAWNKTLTQRELNTAVQTTIDRIVFLRICEDRGIEDYGRLLALTNSGGVYGRLGGLFQQADERYNSGLFHFHAEKGRDDAPDEWTLALHIDDEPLRHIIKRLYYPDSPYEFAVMPIEILGQVYEQFLGKVIKVGAERTVTVEDKPEVRKAGGVYYTPTYIVDYIVRHTVGALLVDKTPAEISGTVSSKRTKTAQPAVHPLAVLDPACGSGSFLIGAYQFLLDWYRAWYVADGPTKHQAVLFQAAGGEWRLTTAERKRILLAHIYGVDIDVQAVEVTKLSLLLKVLEGETGESLTRQLTLLHQRALPDLSHNIKCGNSLIGADFYANAQMTMLDAEEVYRINTFDWADGFPAIMAAGGFDAVIGNPPYVLGRETFEQTVKDYLASRYYSYGGKYDLYIYFTEKAVQLLRSKGIFAFIIPNTVLVNENALKLRKLLMSETKLIVIKNYSSRVFVDAQVESTVIVVRKDSNNQNHIVRIENETSNEVVQSLFDEASEYRFNINLLFNERQVITKMKSLSTPLGGICDICIGIQLGGSSGSDSKQSFISKVNEDDTYKPVLDGRDINRYSKKWSGMYVRYGDWLHRKRDEKYFLNPKLIVRQIGSTPVITYDDEQYYTLNTIYNITALNRKQLLFLLGIINSALGKWFWTKENSDFKTLFPKIKKSQIENIPIRTINFDDATERGQHDRIVALVERMLALHKQAATARTDQDKTVISRQIKATDDQIDALVYDLYDLTADERALVAGEQR